MEHITNNENNIIKLSDESVGKLLYAYQIMENSKNKNYKISMKELECVYEAINDTVMGLHIG